MKKSRKLMEGQKKIEHAVVNGYQKIEDSVVGRYKKIEDAFVKAFLTPENSPSLQENPFDPVQTSERKGD